MSAPRYPHRNPSGSPHSRYNPQDYAAPPPPPFQPASPPTGPPPPPGHHHLQRNQSATGPRPYNPAAYQDNSIAAAANNIYGPASTSFPSPTLSQAPHHSYQPSLYQPHYGPTSPQLQTTSHWSPASSAPHSRQQSDSTSWHQQHAATPPLPPPPVPSHLGDPSQAHSSSAGSYGVPNSLRPSPSPPTNSHSHDAQYPFENQANNSRYDTSELHIHDSSQGQRYGQYIGSISQHQRTDALGITARHPHSRPLPGPPPRETSVQDTRPSDQLQYQASSQNEEERLAQDELFDQVENAYLGFSNHDSSFTSFSAHSDRFDRAQHQNEDDRRINGYHDQTSSGLSRQYDHDDGYDSEAEAEAGLEAMRMAEREEADDRRRYSETSGAVFDPTGSHRGSEAQFEPDEDDYHNIDMSMYGGGYDAPHMSYGEDANDVSSTPRTDALESHHPSTSSRGSAQTDQDRFPPRTSSNTSVTNPSVRPPYSISARVDESGTGGFTDPGRRMSFDKDDDNAYLDMPDHQAYARDSQRTPEIQYQPPPSTGRPLPSLPQGNVPSQYPSLEEVQQNQFYAPVNIPTYPTDPDSVSRQSEDQQSSHVPRSQSLGVHSNSQHADIPIRSKTDAEERKRMTMIRASTYGQAGAFEGLPSEAATDLGLDLPTIPATRRFQPSKLTQRDFDRCSQPWALSSIVSWLRSMAEGETELKEYSIVEALVNLFTFKVPNMNIAEAECLGSVVISEMFAAETLVHEEEWLRFGLGTTAGVLFQLTGRGCYAPNLHDHDTSGHCYSRHCQRTVKKVSIDDDDPRQAADWSTFYSLKPQDVQGVSRKEVERQNNLHEIVQSEYKYMDNLKKLRMLYKDALQSAQPSILPPKYLKSFLNQVFGKLDAVQKANEDYLLPQLKYRQQEEGPWITGFSDIFRDWIRKAKTAYIEYGENFPNADFLVRKEARKNVIFSGFLEGARNNKLSEKLPWDNFLKAPITKLQRYSLLLSSVHKNMLEDSEEKINLGTALSEIRAVTREVDARYAESERKVKLAELQSKLILRPEMKKEVDLKLTQWGRELFFSGELQRNGSNRFTWLDTFAILLDNYLVLSKAISHRESKSDQYDVSKMPIPMDLLILEGADDDPVVKSSMKGITAMPNAPTKATPETRSTRAGSTASPKPSLMHQSNSSTNTSLATVTSNSSDKSMVVNTPLSQDSRDEKILYPFRVRHLGKDTYTLFAGSAKNRQEWCEKILEAKTKHAASLFAQNAEPFRVRIVADSAFAYDTYSAAQRSVLVKGTPLHRALQDVEKQHQHLGRPAPICRAKVNCATSFTQHSGQHMLAIGTDYGVYLAESGKARGWTRAIPAIRVTQMAVLEEFSLLLLIADKSLIAYHLDVVCPPATSTNGDSSKKSPQKLSGARDVGFFAVGRMKDRTLVFYEKRESRSSVFKILEPVYKKSNTHKTSRPFMSSLRGNTEFFRDYDEFYIPADCTGLDLFTSSLSVATSKGFEIITLDKKTAWSVPDLKASHVASIAARLRDVAPLAMFRLAADGSELLCVYEECAVYVNKYGDISRSVVLEFVGKARQASLVGGYLVLFDQEFIEVRDAFNGRLKQVIAGKDVRCLDNGRGQAGATTAAGQDPERAYSMGVQRTIKFALQHPENEKTQIVAELLLNDEK